MKTFTKVFIVSFLCFFISFYAGSISSLKESNLDISENMGFGFYEKENLAKKMLNKLERTPKVELEFKTLQEAIKDSSRVNFLVLGMEDVRTDSILMASFNKDSKDVDVISIPRDTYIHRKNFNSGEERKINSVYFSHGVDGVMKTVSYILEDIPIHHYIILDYEGVEKIVDIVGGVEVNVPFDMKYSDHTATPPLSIDIKKGIQTLDGKKSLEFMRWRKNNFNKGGYIDGDIGRIKSQQQLLTSLAGKAKDNILPIITKGIKYVDTDLRVPEVLSLGRNAIGIKEEDIEFSTLPGKSDLRPINKKVYSYYVYNQKEVKLLLEKIYNVKPWSIHNSQFTNHN